MGQQLIPQRRNHVGAFHGQRAPATEPRLAEVAWKLAVIKTQIRTAPTNDEIHRVAHRIVKSAVVVALVRGSEFVKKPIQIDLAHALISKRASQLENCRSGVSLPKRTFQSFSW